MVIIPLYIAFGMISDANKNTIQTGNYLKTISTEMLSERIVYLNSMLGF